MAIGREGAVTRQLRAIFDAGVVAGLSDADLLGRFAGQREVAAFEALVARHGPLVLGVCRNILRDSHAAEDAFQATFLVLARRAGEIRKPDSLGPWLHGVATRVAAGARADLARQRSHECVAVDIAADDPREDIDAEGRAAIHEEVSRLPEKYRSPVVLCYFEGLTHDEAAGRLGWPVGTVRGRLARARDLLRGRLVRRGLAPTAAALAFGPGRSSATAAVSEGLQWVTVRAAQRVAAGEAITAGACSATVAALTEGALKTMLMTKLKLAAATVAMLIAVFTATGAGMLARQDGGEEKEEPAAVASSGTKPRAAAPAGRESAPDGADPTPASRPEVDERITKMEKVLQTLVKQSEEIRGTLRKLDEKKPGTTGNAFMDADLDNLLAEAQGVCGMIWAELPAARGNEAALNEIRGKYAEMVAVIPVLKGRAGKLRSDIEQIEETVAMLEEVREVLFSPAPRTEGAQPSRANGDDPGAVRETRSGRRAPIRGEGRRTLTPFRTRGESVPVADDPEGNAPAADPIDSRLQRLERMVETLMKQDRPSRRVQPEE